ncbi:MAG: polyhydroxyalkanoate synthesis repressor PhaR [Pseudomonadota bacterium]
MGKKSSKSDTIVIKKYANRRLYDTSTSTYVTLDHLSDLVRKEIDFEVRDAKTGEDLTRSVLTQIIFEQETKGNGALPTNFLRQLIKFYGDGMQSVLPAWLDMSMNSFADRQEKWRSTMGKAFPMSPLGVFEEQAKRNVAMFEQAMKMMMPGVSAGSKSNAHDADDSASPDYDELDIDITDPVSIMQAQMAAMQAQLDILTKKSDK